VISLSDANCPGIYFYGNSVVRTNQLPVVQLGADTSICLGQNIILNAGTNDHYIWSDNSSGQTLTVNMSGHYTVTVTDNNGCSNSDQINVSVFSTPTSGFSFNISNQDVSFINNSQNASNYFWDFGDGTTSTDVNPSHRYLSPGIYTVVLTSSNSACGQAGSTNNVNITETGISENDAQLQLSIFPNPSNGLVTINVVNTDLTNVSFEVFNSLGQIVYSKKYSGLNASETINLSGMASGTYTVKIKSNEAMKVAKLILNN